jgi:hypothetical protein
VTRGHQRRERLGQRDRGGDGERSRVLRSTGQPRAVAIRIIEHDAGFDRLHRCDPQATFAQRGDDGAAHHRLPDARARSRHPQANHPRFPRASANSAITS